MRRAFLLCGCRWTLQHMHHGMISAAVNAVETASEERTVKYTSSSDYV